MTETQNVIVALIVSRITPEKLNFRLRRLQSDFNETAIQSGAASIEVPFKQDLVKSRFRGNELVLTASFDNAHEGNAFLTASGLVNFLFQMHETENYRDIPLDNWNVLIYPELAECP